MAPRGRTCSVCADPARRAAVDGALSTGSSVADVVALFGPSMGFSTSAAYRHARHAHSPAAPVAVPLPEGERPADALRALVRVQRSQLDALARADAAGDDKLAASAADRIRAVTHELVEIAGIDATTTSDSLAGYESFVASLRRAAVARPSLAADMATGFREIGDEWNADDLDGLAAAATAYNDNRNN